MKEMNQEAKDSLVDILQKMLKEAQSKELAYSAKVLEETAQKLTKEIESIVVS